MIVATYSLVIEVYTIGLLVNSDYAFTLRVDPIDCNNYPYTVSPPSLSAITYDFQVGSSASQINFSGFTFSSVNDLCKPTFTYSALLANG